MGQNWRGGASKSDLLPTVSECGGGFVYLIGKSENGPTKVGVSKTVRKRVKSLETAIGERFGYLWASEECTNSEEIESALLTHFRKHRTIGEWLDLPFRVVVEAAKEQKYERPDYESKLDRLTTAVNKVKPINRPDYPRV